VSVVVSKPWQAVWSERVVRALVVVVAVASVRSVAAQPTAPAPTPTPAPALTPTPTPAPAPTPTPTPTPAPAPTPTPAPAEPVAPVAPTAPTAPAPAPVPEPAPAAPTPAEPTPAPGDTEPAPTQPEPTLRSVELHGFVSEGAYWSTDNDYIGKSSRGGLDLFEVGLNVSTEVAERLRVGAQIFARDFGRLEDPPRFDWAFLDYRWRGWLGLRAGIIKMPFGLYNEYTDIDSARLPILMPQSLYSFIGRDALLSHRGFAAYGTRTLPAGGELEYQAWLGTLSIPESALVLIGATLDAVTTKYVTGAQLYWHPPLEGLRVGGTFVRTSIDFDLTLSPALIQTLVMMGRVPADFDGKLVISQRPVTWVIGSAEYTRGDWLFAAEYSRSFRRTVSTLPALVPTFEEDSELFYGMATHRVSPRLELGGYYSVNHVDADDRAGRNAMRFPNRIRAWQRDLTATLRFDINDHWLWKLEGHFIDGAASLPDNPNPVRYWGLVLLRSTVTF
jgi:hypothetical protein